MRQDRQPVPAAPDYQPGLTDDATRVIHQRPLARDRPFIRTERDGSRGDEGRHDHLETLPRARRVTATFRAPPFFAPVSARVHVSRIAGGGYPRPLNQQIGEK